MSKTKPLAGLDALRALKPQLERQSPPLRLRPQARKPSTTPVAVEEIDFAAAMQGIQRLSAPNRAEIARPKPAALPRPRIAAEEPEAPRPQRAPRNESEWLAQAMEDVVRLPPSGRIDPQGPQRRKAMVGQALAPADAEQLAAWLDAAPRPEDPAALFRHAIGSTTELKNVGRVEHNLPGPPPLPRQSEADRAAVLHESIETPLSFQDRLDIGDEAAFLREGLPRRILTDLRRGRWVVQAELDLHGMTRDEARLALGLFLAQRLAKGERCVRVIHGKGNGSPGKLGVLRQLSRNWLAQREEILAFCQARPHEGGDGAVLVLLRAPRAGE